MSAGRGRWGSGWGWGRYRGGWARRGAQLAPGAVGSPGWEQLRREVQPGGLNVSVGRARRGRRGRAEASAVRMGGRDS